MKKIKSILLGILLITAMQYARAQSTCATAIDLNTNNCDTLNFGSALTEVWLSFTADSAVEFITVRGDTSAAAAKINWLTVYRGSCSHPFNITGDSTFVSSADSQFVSVRLTGLTVSNTYWIRIVYLSNTSTNTNLSACKMLPLLPAAACSSSGCTIFTENFNYSSIICASCCGALCNGSYGCNTPGNIATCPSYTMSFGSTLTTPAYSSQVPCWGTAWGTPQIMSDRAYMWDQHLFGVGGANHHIGEGIYRSLPNTLSSSKVYVLKYKYATASSPILENLYTAITPTGANTWPTSAGSYPNSSGPPYTSGTTLDHLTNLSNTSMVQRQICFSPPSNGMYDLLFYPYATSTVSAEHLYLDDVELYEINSTPVAATSTLVCSGQSTTLSNNCTLPSGLVTYSWAPSGSLSCSTCANPTATPTVTTTYTLTLTVQGSNNSCSTVSGTVTVTVSPGTASATASATTTNNCGSSTTLCPGGSYGATLSATSNIPGATYTWNPGSLSGTPVAVTPTVTTVYTVTASSGTCTATSSVTITVGANCNCSGTALTTPTSSTVNINSGTTWVMNTSITIPSGGTYNINSGAVVSMAPGVTITVSNGATLNISGAQLKACNAMWQGIIVNAGGTVNVNGNALIEDAIIAIDNGASSGNTNTGSPSKIIIDRAMFNCNRTAVRMAFYQNSTNSNYSTSFFKVNDATFTCRCGLSLSNSSGALNTYVYVNGGASASLSDYYAVANNTAATLKNPYLGQNALEGIHLENNGVVTSATPAQYVHHVGTTGAGSALVVFDNLLYGVNATNASFQVDNSAFQYSKSNTSGHSTTVGYAINAINNNKDWYNGIYVYNSNFFHVVRGVHTVNYYKIDATGNKMASLQGAPNPSGFALPSNPYGDYGIFAKTVRFENPSSPNVGVNLSSNTFYNINNCIDFVIDASAGYNAGNGESVGPVAINSNGFQREYGSQFPNAYIGNAIVVDNTLSLSSQSSAPVAGSGTQITISGNNINDAFRGILARNQKYQAIRNEGNGIVLKSEYNDQFGNETTQYGIKHDNVIYTAGAGSYGADIYYNLVTGFSSTYGHDKKKGIWVSSSANQYVTCNTVSNAGRAMEFSGTNTNLFWRQNTMQNSEQFYVLSSSGVIPTQGGAADGSDNKWIGSSTTHPGTVADASIGPNSIIYIHSGVNTVPSGHINPNAGFAYTAYVSTSLPNATSASTYSCSTVPPTRQTKPGKAKGKGFFAASLRSSGDTALNLSEVIVLDSLDYPVYADENAWTAKLQVYQLALDENIRDSSEILSDFYTASQSSSYRLLGEIEDSLRSGNFSAAASLANNFSPANSIEENYQRFYQLYTTALLDSALSPGDSTALESLAASCPMIAGNVVYQARAFHNSWYNSFVSYEDNCPQNEEVRNAGQGKPATAENRSGRIGNVKITVYPNPNSGRLYFALENGSNATYRAELYTLAGTLVMKKEIIFDHQNAGLNINTENGMYLLRLYASDGSNAGTYKVIVNK